MASSNRLLWAMDGGAAKDHGGFHFRMRNRLSGPFSKPVQNCFVLYAMHGGFRFCMRNTWLVLTQ